MNIAIKPENMNTRQALAGKVSLITVGLGIARALAAAGSEVQRLRCCSEPCTPLDRVGTIRAAATPNSVDLSRGQMLDITKHNSPTDTTGLSVARNRSLRP